MNYVKTTKWGYEIWRNKKQVGAGVGLSILQFVEFQLPTTKTDRKLAKRGIYKLKF